MPINIYIYTHYIVMSDVYLHGNVGIHIYTIHVYCLLLFFEPSFFFVWHVKFIKSSLTWPVMG